MTLTDAKILVTGPAGQIAFPLVEYLAAANDVWGIARFSETGSQEKVDALGVTTRVCDLSSGDFGDLPTDFDYVLHLAAYMAPGRDYDQAMRVNAEGTGLLLEHCKSAKAALVMSTHSVYKTWDDPQHVFVETDPLGDAYALHAETYSMSKIGQEAVARYCARALDLPVVIARMNASYGPNGGLPVHHLDAIVAGQPVTTRWDPCMYSPIYQDDINTQTAAMLDAASVPATIVNWGGDEPVSVQEWAAYMGDLAGIATGGDRARDPGNVARFGDRHHPARASITGPCEVGWKDGVRRTYEARHGSEG